MRKASELGSKLRQRILYKCLGDSNWQKGKVVRVGNGNGIYKNTCWILDNNKKEHKLNFALEIEDWKYLPAVAFSAETNEKVLYFEKDDIANSYFTELKLDKDGANELKTVFAALVPTERHSEPEVIDAKNAELENWSKFSAYEVVDDIGQERITTKKKNMMDSK